MKFATATRTSSVGFGSKTESCSQYMRNFLQQNRRFAPVHTEQQKTAWFLDYSTRKHSYSLADLLQCEHKDLAIAESPAYTWTRKSHMHLAPVIEGVNGFWHVLITWDTEHKIFDFAICVFAGDCYRFQPEAIKRCISNKYGGEIYATWRSMILDDLHSLKRLVEYIRERISFVAPSITCSDSSARLCRRVGIPVRNDVAFLFPSNYS